MAAFSAWLLAAAVVGSTPPPAADTAPPKPAEPPPSLELLEYLGEWTDDKGEDLDPFMLSAAVDASGGTHE